MGTLSRRSFLTGSALTAGAIASLGIMGCAPKQASSAPGEQEGVASGTADAATDVRAHAAKLNPQNAPSSPASGTCPSLFTEWKMGALTLPNRVVKSAAGFIGVTSRGITGDLHLQHYASLAKGGASIVYCDDFAELYDHFKAVPDVGKFAEWTEDELRTFASAIKDNGSLAGYQLATMGLMFSGFEPDPNALFQSSDCMDMTAQEIQDLIADTVKVASTLKACGFDCVEINAAGENIGQTFMSRNRNKRDDEYGPQSFENRTRFVCEIVRGIKETCGDDFPVQVLINGVEENDKNVGDNALFTTVEENKEMCKLIEEAGADSLHIRIGPCGMHVAEFAGDLYFAGYGIEGTTGYGTQFDFQRHWQGMLKADQSGLGVMTKVAAEIKKAVSIPVGAVTYMDPARDPEFFERLIADGEIDFILMNRPLSVEPEYLAKLKEGRLDEIRPCTRCMHCHWDADLEGNQVFSCRTNAAHPFRIVSGQLPGLYEPEPAANAKNVMVVGGGPAGMEAARVAAERGHNVTLYERKGALGGLLEFASNVKGPHENLIPLKTYLAKQLEVVGVNVVTDQEVDASFINEQAPDAVVLAVGAVRDTLGLSGSGGTNVVSIDDFLTADVADDVVVVGSNAQAIDTVMYLMAQGKHVQVVTPSPASAIGAGHSYWIKTYTQPLIKALGTRFWPQAEVVSVNDGSVTIKTDTGAETELACGTLIEALDGLPNTDLAQELSMDVYPVGDCANPFNIGEAICTANAAARTI
ncbi:tat (twin-arginine translocation) pathway signal sequence [Gordonibacter sp. An230]|uniref:oxidoreductase n=1 Tax=Gordonibacter sp. An230 TaxID=1965592 RepID=UPI000B3757F9|nr:FAD-dependent oxidoreductase [Gordonibacter sp. An230]OUO92518.1 tat (twin-arginine translocation) pathway signal sequence [Gordonibacter sp. An230]